MIKLIHDVPYNISFYKKKKFYGITQNNPKHNYGWGTWGEYGYSIICNATKSSPSVFQQIGDMRGNMQW